MSALDTWVHKSEDGKIWLITENDGWTFMNRGPEREERVLDPNDPSDQALIERYLK